MMHRILCSFVRRSYISRRIAFASFLFDILSMANVFGVTQNVLKGSDEKLDSLEQYRNAVERKSCSSSLDL